MKTDDLGINRPQLIESIGNSFLISQLNVVIIIYGTSRRISQQVLKIALQKDDFMNRWQRDPLDAKRVSIDDPHALFLTGF